MPDTKGKNKPEPKKDAKIEDLDLDPEAWPKFEKLIRDSAKGRPAPRPTKKDAQN